MDKTENMYTSKEQSKKLIEAGLDPESSDMCYLSQTPVGEPVYFSRPTIKGKDVEQYYSTSIPCWSVGGLLKLIPGGSLYKHIGEDTWSCGCAIERKEVDNIYQTVGKYKTQIEALVKMVLWLLDNQLLYLSVKSTTPVPTTIDEAIDTLEKMLSEDNKKFLLENGPSMVHHTLGRWIRNEWGLWGGGKLKECFLANGIEHPDDMSHYIITECIERLKNNK